MKFYAKVCSFSAAVILAMVVSLLAPISVVADDSTPPPVQTEPPPPIETEAPLPTEEEVTSANSIDNQKEVGNEQEIIQDASEIGENTSQSISAIIGQLPEETVIRIETQDGIEPLATLQAENLILIGDPIWCPDGIPPIPTVNGCSISYTSLEDLITNFPDPGGPGVIWILEGIDSSASSLSLNGSNYANWDAHNLVIQGGWNGDALGTISSATTIDMQFEVINWTGNITINDLIITGTSGIGLYVDTDGDVALNDLEINGNDASGLYVNSGGLVEAENIKADNNGLVSLFGYGAEIRGSEFHLIGTNSFSGNYESGLYVSTTGDIQINNNLTANNNGVLGYAVGAELFSATGNVDLLGINQFVGNRNDGLYVEAFSGSIVAENITASDNGIGNSYAPGAELIAASLNLTGNNVFTGNNNVGLYADISGDIDISNVIASNNGLAGLYGPGAELYSTGNVTITGNNVFSGNSSDGLVIDAAGNITVLNVDALNNDNSGLVLATNSDAYIDCGSVLNNGNTQIDTAMAGGVLTLAGVDFGGDPDQNVGINGLQLTLVSNTCFDYPDYYNYDNQGFGAGGKKDDLYSGTPPLAVKYVSIVRGQNVSLDCAYYQATYVLLEDGDGAIIPCPIVGSVILNSVEEINSYNLLPDKNIFVSGMDLDISGDDQMFDAVDATDIIWYFNGTSEGMGGYEALYWDGDDWVEITDQIPPFLTIFFLVPDGLNHQNLAILYWDGAAWVELSNGTQLGQGRIVSGLGYNQTSEYFQANVNFTGVFVLVQK
jgi:hypothetical protein